MTDHWKPYELFLPPDLHTQSKAETFTVAGYNSLFRHYWLGYAVNRNVTLSACCVTLFCHSFDA
jgi:IS1 family transposase